MGCGIRFFYVSGRWGFRLFTAEKLERGARARQRWPQVPLGSPRGINTLFRGYGKIWIDEIGVEVKLHQLFALFRFFHEHAECTLVGGGPQVQVQ